MADAVYRVDPRVDRWSDQQLQSRLEYRREAMNLIEHTIATPASTTYPFVSTLSGHPSPIIDPGPASALLLLANALDRFPVSQRGHYVEAIVAVGLALDDADLQATLQVLSELPRDQRKRLLANQAAPLKHLFAGELAFQDAESQRDVLKDRLVAEQTALDAEKKALSSAIEAAQGWEKELSDFDRRCSAQFVVYRECLAKASHLSLPN